MSWAAGRVEISQGKAGGVEGDFVPVVGDERDLLDVLVALVGDLEWSAAPEHEARDGVGDQYSNA